MFVSMHVCIYLSAVLEKYLTNYWTVSLELELSWSVQIVAEGHSQLIIQINFSAQDD